MTLPARLDRPGVRSVLDLLAEAQHGLLAVRGADGWPRAVPLNYVHLGARLYLHGSPSGEKMEAIAAEPRVGFTVLGAGALIPSYLRHPRSACPATQYYRSAMVRGRARVASDPGEKAAALEALMRKLQPEGGYEEIRPEAALYTKALRTTAVVAIEIEAVSGKFKVGQNLGREVHARVVRELRERGGPGDEETVRRMLEWREHPVDVQLDAAEWEASPEEER